MKNEIWRDIKGYEGYYQVSNKGRVKSLSREVQRKGGSPLPLKERLLSIRNGNYLNCTLSKGNQTKVFTIHRLVAQSFIPEIEGINQINHINGDKTDNRVENLEWCTPKENKRHSIDVLGKSQVSKGKDHYLTSLSEKEVLRIRSEYNEGFTTHRKLATKFGVTHATIQNIIHRITWKHI